MLLGDLIPILRPPHKRLIDLFDVWLQVCTNYQMEIVSALPSITWNWQPTLESNWTQLLRNHTLTKLN